MKKEYFQTLLSGLNLAYEFTLMEESESTLKVLSKVTDLTRYFSEDAGDSIMLGQELQRVETFLSIQKLRFQEDFEYEIYIKDELNSLFVKRFYFIESIMKFFIHYLEVKPNKKIVKIYFENDINNLYMRIEELSTPLCEKYTYYL